MIIDARSVALLGVSYGALAMASLGYLSFEQQVYEVEITPISDTETLAVSIENDLLVRVVLSDDFAVATSLNDVEGIIADLVGVDVSDVSLALVEMAQIESKLSEVEQL